MLAKPGKLELDPQPSGALPCRVSRLSPRLLLPRRPTPPASAAAVPLPPSSRATSASFVHPSIIFLLPFVAAASRGNK